MNKALLIICDGLGYREQSEHNAVALARTPNLDTFYQKYPFAILKASGEAVGLPEGQMGTSEANHLVIGSGRIIYQNLVKISHAAKNLSLRDNPAIKEALDHVKYFDSTLHLKGLAGPGGVHAHSDHLKALVKLAKEWGIDKVAIHLFTDGRDTPPKSAHEHIDDVENFLAEQGIGRIVSIGGRYFAMDRDNNRDRTEKHFRALIGQGERRHNTAKEAISHAYTNNTTDEFIEPAHIGEEIVAISPNDAVIFTNFRSDRAKQLSRRLLDEKIDNLKFVAMTKYEDDYDGLDVRVAFSPEEIKNTLSEVISRAGLKQLKITETEKYPHLTFYFNAQKYEAEPGEERILIESNKDVANHDEKPEMKAAEIADRLIEEMRNNNFNFIAANLVNCDMVGHSGKMSAIIHAVETVDTALGRIIPSAIENGYDVILTADHGNAEETFDPKSNQPLTAHTLNPVPFVLISDKHRAINRSEALLSDIAPTILDILNLDKPQDMTGESLVGK